MRRIGLSTDSLRACEVVTVGGDLVRASATENAELFWVSAAGVATSGS